MRTCPAVVAGLVLASTRFVVPASAEPSGRDLARFYGWDEPRIIVMDKGAGPAVSADFNGDGLIDLACVNNAKSRIEIHLQRAAPRTDQEVEREYKANQLPPSPFFDRVEIPVSHRITAFRACDVDGDGLLDILYLGDGAEIVILRQTAPASFGVLSKRRVKDLHSRQNGMRIADVLGDAAPELLVIAGGRINIFGLSSSAVVGEPVVLGSGDAQEQILALFTEDYTGDGLTDILGVIPNDPTPIRIWIQDSQAGSAKAGVLGPERRFEMPPLVEVEPVRFPDRRAASFVVIERPTRRIVLYDYRAEPGEAGASSGGGETDADYEVRNFPGGAGKGRSLAVADIDGDGLPDLVATDQQANSILLYRQRAGQGFLGEERFSALKDPKAVAVGQWDDSRTAEVFVLSEADKVVGVCKYERSSAGDRLAYPQPIPLATPGGVPIAMAYVPPPAGPALAVVVKDKRDHTLEVHRPAGAAPAVLKLEGVSRPPQSMLVGDFDHDRRSDALLLTPGDPLVMVRDIEGGQDDMRLLTDKTMPQFGLVQAAGPENTAELDINGDGFAELLIADQNFVRACAFSSEKGWRVVEQITLPDASSSLATLAVLQGESPMIIAFDKANKRLVLMSKDSSGLWAASERLRFPAFAATALHAGRFTGRADPAILAAGEAAFAVIRLTTRGASLVEVAAYRSDDDRFEHEITVGDVNNDGFMDLVVLDAREQMCQVFALSRSRRLHFATEFKVFESRLFGRGDDRQYEPRNTLIADFTGDGLDDLCLEVHDRCLIYPQMKPTP